MTLAYTESLVDYAQRPAAQIDRPSASARRELEFLHLLAVAPCDQESGTAGQSPLSANDG